MKKEKIFSKFNIRNFNDELEEILTVKNFTEEVKNEILNMVYKIEEAYNEYKIAKVEVLSESSFLENILLSIKDSCNLIEISNSKEMKEKKVVLDYEKGNIAVVSNNIWLLYAILGMLRFEKRYKNEEDMLQNKPIFDFLEIGYNINNIEVIRDFNGWSWITSLDEQFNLKANLIYQNLQFLLGNRSIENFMRNIIIQDKNLIDVLQKKLEKKYDKEIISQILIKIKQIAIVEIAKSNEEYKNILIEIKNRKQEELNLMENKAEYLKEITYIKKTNIEIIKGIDKTINNRELLQLEYKLRNSMLKNNEKIFSVSYLVDILQQERKQALDKISEINNLMDPKTYVNKKTELKKAIDNIITEDDKINDDIVELQKLFIKCVLKEIHAASERSDIIKLLYKVRYYINILFEDKKYVKDIIELKEEIKSLEEKIIQKLFEYKLVVEFSDNKKINKEILVKILNTRIINLQNVFIVLKKDKNLIKIQIYDEDELVEKETLEIEKLEDKGLKLDKKIKIFV